MESEQKLLQDFCSFCYPQEVVQKNTFSVHNFRIFFELSTVSTVDTVWIVDNLWIIILWFVL